MTTRGRRRWTRLLSELAIHLGGLVVVVWGAATAGFIAMKLIPGDPVDVMLGVQAHAGQGVRDKIRADWGLDESVWAQYGAYLGRLLRGDLGESYQLRKPVIDVLGQQLWPTVQLTALAFAFALIIALAVALFAQGPVSSRVASLGELVAISAPTFWSGMLLLAVFAYGLGWFPVAASAGFPALVLPALTLALPVAGIMSQVLRAGLESAAATPFAVSARARGVGRVRWVAFHALRHSGAGTLTLTGYLAGSLLGGAVLVETVFGRAGLGGVTVRAILGRDLPVVLGIIIWSAIVFVVLNRVVDLVHRLLDPRLAVRA